MAGYSKRFHEQLKKGYSGSLVKVEDVKAPNAKEYLSKLAKAKLIEKVTWGWYWIPDKIRDPWDFFEKDKGFKIICCQTAASLWNQDFVHREAYSLKVLDRGYGRALEEFAKMRGWMFKIEYVEKPTNYVKFGKLLVQDIGEVITECISDWAFIDAFAVLYSNRDKISLDDLAEQSYWKRIRGTKIRVRQALEYGSKLINILTGKEFFDVRKVKLEDEYVKREIEEAVEKVVELG